MNAWHLQAAAGLCTAVPVPQPPLVTTYWQPIHVIWFDKLTALLITIWSKELTTYLKFGKKRSCVHNYNLENGIKFTLWPIPCVFYPFFVKSMTIYYKVIPRSIIKIDHHSFKWWHWISISDHRLKFRTINKLNDWIFMHSYWSGYQNLAIHEAWICAHFCQP